MPISEWTCKKCGARFEILTFGPVPEDPVCEECGSKEVEKQLSRFASSASSASSSGGSSSSGGGCAPGRGFT